MFSNSLPRIRRPAGLAFAALASAALVSCVGSFADFITVTTSAPVTLVAGSSVDLTIDVTCESTSPLGVGWIEPDGISPKAFDRGVALPSIGPVDCSTPIADNDYSGTTTARFYAADNAELGLHPLILRASQLQNETSDRVDVDVTVIAPVSPGFTITAPGQAALAAGADGVDVPVTVQRSGHDGAIALFWQPLTLEHGMTAGAEGGIRVANPVPDGASTATVRIEGPGVAAKIRDGTLSTILLRAHGGTTDRSVLVQLLPNVAPPSTPTGFRATPDVTAIALLWDAAANVLTYKLEREAAGGIWEVVAADISGAATSTSDVARTPDTPYSYRLSATNVNGTSPFAALTTRTLPTPPPPGPTGWYQIGPAVMTGSEVEPQPSMLIDALGRPVVAYREVASSSLGRIIVKRYNAGGFWGQMGSGQLNNGLYDAFTPTLATDAAGVLYAAWSEYTGVSQRVYASRFPLTGGIWESIVPGDQPLDDLGAAASRPAIIVLPGGVPVVAWIQGGTIQVRTLAGGQWVQPAGGSGFTATTAYDLRLIADGATPVLAWAEGVGATNAIKLARGTPSGGGFTFTQVGGNASLPLPAGMPSFTLFNPVVDGAVDYLVYAEGNTEFTVRSRRFNGGAWEDFGAGIVPFTGPQEVLSIATPPNRLVVAFSVRAVSLNGSVFGASYVGQNGWTFLTDILNLGRAEAWFGLSVAMASDRSPVVAGGVLVSDKYELRVRQYIQP